MSLAIFLRSLTNLIIYIIEVVHETSRTKDKDGDDENFANWFAKNWTKTYVFVEVVYLIVLTFRNISLTITLTRWLIIKHSLKELLLDQVDYYYGYASADP